MSSKPTMDRSCGSSSPDSLAPFITPRANTSLEQKIAVGGFFKVNNFLTA